MRSNDVPDSGEPVSCESALATLAKWLKPVPASVGDGPSEYEYDYMIASGIPGATSVRFNVDPGTGYTGSLSFALSGSLCSGFASLCGAG